MPDGGVGEAGVPGPVEADALAALDEHVMHVLRLDEPDPIAAWRERVAVLVSSAERLTERGFDALHYEGPGTDLTVGLLQGAAWQAAHFETVDGIEHLPNIPTEEVFTTPDPERTEGHVTSSKPLVLADGTVVRDLRVRFEGGRAVQIVADTAQDTMRTIAEHDERRRPPGRGRAGRCRGPHRQARHGLLRHADRRERGQSHRARPGLPVPDLRRGPRPLERERDPHRLHDRNARDDGHRHHRRRRPRARAVQGHWQI